MTRQSKDGNGTECTTNRFIDLFAGIGGIRLGFEKAGFSCVWANDHDKQAAQTYAANFGDEDLVVEDIRGIDPEAIPEFDLLCAGFPCQPFSIAGVSKKLSLGRPVGFDDETQGTLFHEIARILKARRPQAFFLENVKNLETHDHGRTFAVIETTLRGLGYSFFHKVVNAKQILPQNRERIFMIGFRDPKIEYVFPEIGMHKTTVSDILEPKVDKKYTLSDHLWEYLREYAARQRAKGNGFGYGLVDMNGTTRTLSARYYKDGSEILIPQAGRNPRRLTPRECARLQGFPDSFKIPVSDTAAYKQFGNSVAVPVIETLAKALRKTLIAPVSESEKTVNLTEWV